MTRHHIEIESLDAFDTLVAGRETLTGVVVQSVDLRGRTLVLSQTSVHGALFLGCTFAEGISAALQARGALVFPALPAVPFNPYQTSTYRADDLFNTEHYADSFDARVYAFSRAQHSNRTVIGSIAMALHDHAMTEALEEDIARVAVHRRVGIMGGHGVARGTESYAEAATLGRALARHRYSVFTGGGPGAMEAANLGAYLAPHDDSALADALAILSDAPSFADIDAWAGAAHTVRQRWGVIDNVDRSIGIPTWFYGHEPPNQFATVIAKFFANPLREATLLERCQGGIIYLPGAAGTISEVFMDACENYYAAEGNIAPMVLVGREQWTTTLAAWPLLQQLAANQPMNAHIHLVDTAAEAVSIITGAITP